MNTSIIRPVLGLAWLLNYRISFPRSQSTLEGNHEIFRYRSLSGWSSHIRLELLALALWTTIFYLSGLYQLLRYNIEAAHCHSYTYPPPFNVSQEMHSLDR